MTEGILSTSLTFQLFADIPTSYPTQLLEILTRRYSTQTFTVVNEGRRGEWAEEGAVRFLGRLRAVQPEAVLLLEGVNDLNALGSRGVGATIRALDSMVRDARAQGARVFLATLPPARPGSRNGADVADVIPLLNAEIVRLAASREAVLVDVAGAFGRDLSLLGPDGLHPNEAGYQRMAVAFFEAIRTALEVPAPSGTAP